MARVLGFPSDLTLASLTVLGALAVGGGATIVGELTSESVYETLNSDKTSGAPTEDMGFRARRGASPWWVIGWDETNDRTIIGTSSDGTVANTTGGAVVVGSVLAGNGSAAAPSYSLTNDPDSGFYSYSPNVIGVSLGGGVRIALSTAGITLASVGTLGWSSGVIGDPEDVLLARDAANVLAQRNGANAQAFRVYGTTTGSKYAYVLHNGTDCAIGTNSGDLYLQSAGPSSWQIVGTTGLLSPVANGTKSIGDSGLRVKSLFLGGNTPAASAPFLDGTQTWNDAGVAFIGVDWTFIDTASAAGATPFRLRGGAAGTTTLFSVAKNGDATCSGWLTAGTNVRCASASYFVVASRLLLGSSGDGIAALYNYAATDFSRLCFGGVTSAFPSLKRWSNYIQVRLADDTAFTSIATISILDQDLNQVLSRRGAAVADEANADATDLATAITLLNSLKGGHNTLLARLRAATGHGLIA